MSTATTNEIERRIGYRIPSPHIDLLLAYIAEREAAVLAKLEGQEPVAWRWQERGHWFGWSSDWGDHDKAQEMGFPIEYAYPKVAPQQADRQRVPEGWKLVPVEPTQEMLKELGDAWEGVNRATWQWVIAAAPEAPALKHVPLTDERIIEVLGDTKHSQITAVRALIAESHAAPEAPAQADRQRVPDWKPIHTAPTDGTAILVSEGRFIHCVEWNEEFEWWAVDDNKLGPFRLRGSAPTHWMPLPAAPGAAPEAPAQADERAAFEAELRRQCFQKPTTEARDLAWCMWQARAALNKS